MSDVIILIKGAGEMGSAIAHKLFTHGYTRICMTELSSPLAISRATCFSEALFKGSKTIEGVKARTANSSLPIISSTWIDGHIVVLDDPNATIVSELNPDVIIDARNLKENIDTSVNDAKCVIGIGKGFEIGKNCHYLIESSARRISPEDGIKIISANQAQTEFSDKCLIWAGINGVFQSKVKIGQMVSTNEVLGKLNDLDIVAPESGIIHSILRNNTPVEKRTKLLEIRTESKKINAAIRPKWQHLSNEVLNILETAIEL